MCTRESECYGFMIFQERLFYKRERERESAIICVVFFLCYNIFFFFFWLMPLSFSLFFLYMR